MKTSIIGYPRIGEKRELKFWIEDYFRGNLSEDALNTYAKTHRIQQWQVIKGAHIDYIPSNDFSYYDGMLDTAVMLGVIPEVYKQLELTELETYFAMARGYQGEKGDVKARPMKKWFNTNYHYIVPLIEKDIEFKLNIKKLINEYEEAKALGIKTKPVVIGGYTFLKLAEYSEDTDETAYIEKLAVSYSQLINELEAIGIQWVQIDEPILVTDLTQKDIANFKRFYEIVLSHKQNCKVLLQTYFGDLRDCYEDIVTLGFDGIGIDFIEGKKSLELVKTYGVPENVLLFAGVINGKNIWRNDYAKSKALIETLKVYTPNIVLNTSCSLLHVPYSLRQEGKLQDTMKKYFAYAEEKLSELSDLKQILEDVTEETVCFKQNQALFNEKRIVENQAVKRAINVLKEEDFVRQPTFEIREKLQKEKFKMPILPTTTIGSFPQTREIKANRSKFRRGEITQEAYEKVIKEKIKDCIKLQEALDLDVLVHGEYERNDMVEYFGEHLEGYIFTENGWVQSYGTRCVKPPVIWGDVSRRKPITVAFSQYASSLTHKPVKGMLTGPVTILNWSFPREDISLKEMAYQIALAIREEVLDLEANGINIIQVDEAALKEKLPLRRSDWQREYLDWAIKAFRLVHSKVNSTTQIHTHMCYSEFEDIVEQIDDMDADVISFEASRSNLSIINVLNEKHFKTEVGPGIYDIHSPRVPSVVELRNVIEKLLGKIHMDKLWINPDCGLKTRGEEETIATLKNLVAATKHIRNTVK